MPYSEFNPFHQPLRKGSILVEANAGTGKTFLIENLCLRFILEKEIEISSLLILTFTRAATQELKERIRKKFFFAKDALLDTKISAIEDPTLKAILQKIPNKDY